MPLGHEPEDADRQAQFDHALTQVMQISSGMGIEDASPDSIVTAPPFYDGPTLVKASRFGLFRAQLAVRLRFVGYPVEEVAFLTVRQLCEMYVRDSFPPLPSSPLSDGQYSLDFGRAVRDSVSPPNDFPICFVLGAPRSGTTLLRAMLDVHSSLWAPGELHLANFVTMGERARYVNPVLRYMPIPEAAARCGQAVAAFGKRFRRWELDDVSVAEVFQVLYDADPGAMIVDKSPPYCVQLPILERIAQQFPNAKFVHIVRSPHDMVRSYVRMQLHRGDGRLFDPGLNPYQAAEAIWTNCNESSDTFLTSIPADRKCEVRYEDLTTAPAAQLNHICELLGRDFQPEMADPYAEPGATALGAGDLLINLLKQVEPRRPGEPCYPLGKRCQQLAARHGY